MLVKDWLEDFLVAFWPDRLGRAWPGPDSTEGRMAWSEWMKALIELKASREEAELAADRVGAPTLSAIVQEIQTLRREPTPGVVAGDRESAQAASRDCPHCGGGGFVAIPDQRSGEVNAHCVCPMGRWMRSRTSTENLRGIPDFAETLAHRNRPESERMEEAAQALDALYKAGWELRWQPDERQFRFYRSRPDAPRPGPEMGSRLWRYRAEIYALLGEPLDEGIGLDPAEFRGPDGKLDWRRMVRAVGEKAAVPF